jgi:hypothetical protein
MIGPRQIFRIIQQRRQSDSLRDWLIQLGLATYLRGILSCILLDNKSTPVSWVTTVSMVVHSSRHNKENLSEKHARQAKLARADDLVSLTAKDQRLVDYSSWRVTTELAR